jgi:preprotein translocase subunit SecD
MRRRGWKVCVLGAFALVACTTNTSTTSSVASGVILQERPVLAIYSPREQAPLTCSPGACSAEDLAAATVTLAADDGRAYALGSIVFTQDNVASATASQTLPAWSVDLTLDESGTQALTTATEHAAKSSSPEDQIAVVLDGRVIEVPTVQAPITSGRVQLSGFTQQEAESLANTLSAGSS